MPATSGLVNSAASRLAKADVAALPQSGAIYSARRMYYGVDRPMKKDEAISHFVLFNTTLVEGDLMFLRNMVLVGFCVGYLTSPSFADILSIELTPTDVGSADTSYFTTSPTDNPGLFLGAGYAADAQKVDFNTAPDGPLSEGLSVTNEYASYGVAMNSIRISSNIYGGNMYGSGYAAEDDYPQIYTFSPPVIAVGIVNTSPDNDFVKFYSGPGATGTLLFSFQDQQGVPPNYNIDRFVGGIATDGTTIGSFVVSNDTGNLELDELVFVPVPEPTAIGLIIAAACFLAIIRRPSVDA